VAAEIVHNHDIARREGGRQHLLDIDAEALGVDCAVIIQGASIRSLRSAARKVVVFQWPKGAWAFRRAPHGLQPRSGAILVLIQVSSMKTRRAGSMRD
jgi:hypothetical protein